MVPLKKPNNGEPKCDVMVSLKLTIGRWKLLPGGVKLGKDLIRKLKIKL